VAACHRCMLSLEGRLRNTRLALREHYLAQHDFFTSLEIGLPRTRSTAGSQMRGTSGDACRVLARTDQASWEPPRLAGESNRGDHRSLGEARKGRPATRAMASISSGTYP
jgi:hypothetical protein